MAYLGVSLEEMFGNKYDGKQQCKYRNCQNWFYPTSPSNVYCSPECRNGEVDAKHKEEQERKKTPKKRGRPVGWRGKYKPRKIGEYVFSSQDKRKWEEES
jgi:hypothetical protein